MYEGGKREAPDVRDVNQSAVARRRTRGIKYSSIWAGERQAEIFVIDSVAWVNKFQKSEEKMDTLSRTLSRTRVSSTFSSVLVLFPELTSIVYIASVGLK